MKTRFLVLLVCLIAFALVGCEDESSKISKIAEKEITLIIENATTDNSITYGMIVSGDTYYLGQLGNSSMSSRAPINPPIESGESKSFNNIIVYKDQNSKWRLDVEIYIYSIQVDGYYKQYLYYNDNSPPDTLTIKLTGSTYSDSTLTLVE